jgi:hypothetical protein
MKKISLGMFLLAMVQMFFVYLPAQARAEVDVRVSLPALVFPAPPAVIVLPETDVYVAPEAAADLFFNDGWWWRPYQGRWYRSQNYNSGWRFYSGVPAFSRNIPSGWRNEYRAHRWQGHVWNYERIPHRQFQSNWRGWQQNRHWEKQNHWGVQGYSSRAQTRDARPIHEMHQGHETHQGQESYRGSESHQGRESYQGGEGHQGGEDHSVQPGRSHSAPGQSGEQQDHGGR